VAVATNTALTVARKAICYTSAILFQAPILLARASFPYFDLSSFKCVRPPLKNHRSSFGSSPFGWVSMIPIHIDNEKGTIHAKIAFRCESSRNRASGIGCACIYTSLTFHCAKRAFKGCGVPRTKRSATILVILKKKGCDDRRIGRCQERLG